MRTRFVYTVLYHKIEKLSTVSSLFCAKNMPPRVNDHRGAYRRFSFYIKFVDEYSGIKVGRLLSCNACFVRRFYYRLGYNLGNTLVKGRGDDILGVKLIVGNERGKSV